MAQLSQKIIRVIDVNLNRSKEGLRVLEDIFRFVYENDYLRKKIRQLRHNLDEISQPLEFKTKMVKARDAKKDIGKAIDDLELKRNNLTDLILVNFQRVKESLRVLEEFSKLFSEIPVTKLKQMRYEIYQLEKKAILQKINISDN